MLGFLGELIRHRRDGDATRFREGLDPLNLGRTGRHGGLGCRVLAPAVIDEVVTFVAASNQQAISTILKPHNDELTRFHGHDDDRCTRMTQMGIAPTKIVSYRTIRQPHLVSSLRDARAPQ